MQERKNFMGQDEDRPTQVCSLELVRTGTRREQQLWSVRLADARNRASEPLVTHAPCTTAATVGFQCGIQRQPQKLSPRRKHVV